MVPASSTLPDTFASTLIGTQPTVLVAARDYPLPDGPLSIDTLSGFPWVLSQDGCGMRSALSRMLGAAGLPFDVAVEAFGSSCSCRSSRAARASASRRRTRWRAARIAMR